jgi:hypothetical protein
MTTHLCLSTVAFNKAVTMITVQRTNYPTPKQLVSKADKLNRMVVLLSMVA